VRDSTAWNANRARACHSHRLPAGIACHSHRLALISG
jgi:hypothetical protein